MYKCGTFPSQAEWSSHPELSGRLACYSPVTGYTGKPQVSASRTSEASRTDDQCAEEQAPPHTVHHILRNGFGLTIDESASLSRANTVFGQCSHLIQTRESGDSEMLSETLGTYGSSTCGVSARASAYETTSAMAEVPGAKQSVEERSAACLGDPRMHAGASPLVQHEDARAGSLDGQSSQQKNCHYGHVIDGLGSPLRWQTGLWHLDECAGAVAYKLPRVEGSIFSFARLSSTDNESTHPGSDRQHDGGILYQPSRGHSFTPAPMAGGAFSFGRTETFCRLKQYMFPAVRTAARTCCPGVAQFTGSGDCTRRLFS